MAMCGMCRRPGELHLSLSVPVFSQLFYVCLIISVESARSQALTLTATSGSASILHISVLLHDLDPTTPP